MIIKLKTKFVDAEVDLRVSHYQNGQTALVAYDPVDGECVAKATAAVECEVVPGQVVVKNWSECEGMLEALMSAGVVGAPIEWVELGMVDAPVCELLSPELRKQAMNGRFGI